jgi:hypothetical protein
MSQQREHIIKLDYDRPQHPPIRRLCRLLERAGYRPVSMGFRRSPSGKGWHCWIVTEPTPKSLVEVVALQAILGSDPFREAVTLQRARVARGPIMRKMVNVLYAPCVERRKAKRVSE